jgi:hypothetical protein
VEVSQQKQLTIKRNFKNLAEQWEYLHTNSLQGLSQVFSWDSSLEAYDKIDIIHQTWENKNAYSHLIPILVHNVFKMTFNRHI